VVVSLKKLISKPSLCIGMTAVVALSLAACGDDSGSKASSTTVASAPAATGGGTTVAAAPADPLGTPNKATGTPIKLGFAYDGKTDAIDTTGDLGAAKAAAAYANDYLGGIGGHPIQLDDCADNQQPSQAVTCTNQFIADKVPAVLGDTDSVADSYEKGLDAANIPEFWTQVATPGVLGSKNAFVLANALASNYAGPAKIGQDAGATAGTELVIDVPAAKDPAVQRMLPIFKVGGIALDVVPIPPGTADMTPQVQSALDKNPGVVHITGNDTFCISAIQALRTLGYNKPIVIIPQCQSAAFVKSLAGQLDGVVLTTAFAWPPPKDANDPETSLYQAIMAKYGAGTDANGTVAYGGYASMMAFARGMKGATGDVTSASILATLTARAPTPMPLANGATFQCSRVLVPSAPPICSASALEAALDANGALKSYKPLDVSALLK
jgi:branched-chain amino acid transport system substrate-binding protein